MPVRKLDIAEIWEINDPRDVPAYTISEAAHYLNIPPATIRSWVAGAKYTVKGGEKRRFPRVLDLQNADRTLLSFFNLVEAHVLRALRTHHAIKLDKIRRALDYVKQEFGWKRPLIHQEFKTDGISLFVERLGYIVDAAAAGQIVMKEVMVHLERIEWEDSLAVRLFPFTRLDTEDAPRSVFIDPRYSFGRPILRESRIATAVIAERYKAGDSIQSLAEDYGCSQLEIEEGVRCELRLTPAA
ncbi:MAG TPA: DUF433 domain-containing protein [Pirellulales bacterium]|nr:DUF433 domain-containing protein [Pirellulales bacterium]